MATNPRSESNLPAPAYNPFRMLRQSVDRLFDDFDGFGRGFMLARPSQDIAETFPFNAPCVNVAETEKAYEITAEVPGVDEKNIDISVENGVLTIKGEKMEEKEDKEKDYHLVERTYGSFQRSFRLPENVKEDAIEAEYSKGVLKITVPKAEPSSPEKKGRKVEVKAH